MPVTDGTAPMSRRALLRNSAAFALALPTVSSILAACGKDTPASQTLTIATPDKPVKWPIAEDNQPIADGLSPEANATLRLYNYDQYIDPEALKSFESTFDCTVQVSTYVSADEAVAKLRSGQVDFDIYFPSYDAIGKLVTGGLVRPLNHSYIPNIDNVWPDFADPFYDQGWQFTVPYTIYTTGIGWRSDRVDNISALDNPYDVFWDLKYKGRLSILDDYRTAIAMVLLRNGITDINTGDAANLELVTKEFADMTSTTQPKVTVTDYSDLPEGTVDVVQAWSGDMINAVYYLPEGTSPDILHYWFPDDGKGAIDNDCMVVLRSGKNPVLAHLFLNHMLDYDVALANFGAIGYQPPQNQLDPATLVADEYVVPNLETAVVRQEHFAEGYRTLELPPSVDAQWHTVWEQFKAGG